MDSSVTPTSPSEMAILVAGLLIMLYGVYKVYRERGRPGLLILWGGLVDLGLALMGLGLGRSRQKYLYLPEEHNDYIFPILCEELGFVGAVVVILLFILLIVRGYYIAMHARDRFGALLAAGISTHFALQTFLNIGVVTNFLPATGISLPFFSYGGTALLMQLFEAGIVLAVSRQNDNKLL